MAFWNKITRYPRLGLVLLAYIAFIALGMPDGLLGVAWPSIRAGFSISLDAIGMLMGASVSGYMIATFLNGPLISRLGVGRVLAASCALTGLGLIGYTLVPEWWMMTLLGVFSGLGAGAIDAGLNAYVAAHFSEGLMQWLHASYGVGITLGPLIMTTTLTTLNSWRAGYQVVGGFQIVLAFGFSLTLGLWNHTGTPAASDQPKRLTDYQTPLAETLRQPLVWLSVLLFLLYVGAEVTLGTWSYSLLTEARGIAPTAAGLVTGSYWATFTIGRVLAGLYAKRLGIHVLTLGGIGGALLGSLLLLWNPCAAVNLIAVAVVGFSVAPIFPALMSGTGQRVGARFAANTIGMQMAASGLGTVGITSLVGVLARQVSLEIVPLAMLTLLTALLALYLTALRSTPAA